MTETGKAAREAERIRQVYAEYDASPDAQRRWTPPSRATPRTAPD